MAQWRMIARDGADMLGEGTIWSARDDAVYWVDILAPALNRLSLKAGGTSDRLTSIGHSRKLASRIPNAQLLEVTGAGHMVPLERHDQVNAELDQLITAATTRAGTR